MTEVLKGLAGALIRMPQVPSDQLADLLRQHARLVRVVTGEPEAEYDDTGASASS